MVEQYHYLCKQEVLLFTSATRIPCDNDDHKMSSCQPCENIYVPYSPHIPAPSNYDNVKTDNTSMSLVRDNDSIVETNE